ncbi:hypothetical protein ACQEVF_51795 [Nonomuraea polychroma]|uniref:hypothetical protein n=1 Tax=Nonomuraea polychroma TaxID=46176 RepID=UPI003D8F2F20
MRLPFRGFSDDLNVPYAFFGVGPTLFDAPARPSREDMTWVAHSFLCFSPDLATREVRAVTGFSWGFDIRSKQVTLRPAQPLTAACWDGHLPRLGVRAGFPGEVRHSSAGPLIRRDRGPARV